MAQPVNSNMAVEKTPFVLEENGSFKTFYPAKDEEGYPVTMFVWDKDKVDEMYEMSKKLDVTPYEEVTRLKKILRSMSGSFFRFLLG